MKSRWERRINFRNSISLFLRAAGRSKARTTPTPSCTHCAIHSKWPVAHHEGLSVEGHKCGGVNRKRGSHRRKEKYSTGPSEATTREGNKRSRVSQPLPHRSLALLLYFARRNVCKTYLSRTQAGPGRSDKLRQEKTSPNHVQILFSGPVYIAGLPGCHFHEFRCTCCWASTQF